MVYHDYLNTFCSEEELVENIKLDIINSKDFVNLVLGYTRDKSNEDKNSLFNNIAEKVAITIAESKHIEV